jgi:hypothetical protein
MRDYKTKIAIVWIFTVTHAYGQLDRAGNVIESDGGGGAGFDLNGLAFPAIGVIAGLIAALVKPKLLVTPCVVSGAIAGFVVDILVRVMR